MTRVVPVLVFVSLATLLGCSGPTTAGPVGQTALSELIDGVLQDPVADQFSGAQRELLERARASGEVTFEDVSEALEAAFACMEGAGVTVQRQGPDNSRGFPVPQYLYGADLSRPESEWGPLAEACLLSESAAIESIYQTQPSALAAEEEYFRLTRRPAFVACLEEHGVEVPEDATYGEIDTLSYELYIESSGTVWEELDDGSSLGHETTPDEAVDCWLESE